MDAHDSNTPQGAPAPQSHAIAEPPPRPRWKHPAVLALAGAFAGAVLLVLLAPTIATSRFVLSRVEANLGERIGRTVVIGDLDFGWFTDFRLDAFSIPALPSEGGAGPMLSVGKVHMPVKVTDVLGDGPLNLGLISVGSVEANIVRFDDGRTNMQIALAGFESSAAPGDSRGDGASKPATPLPIRALAAKASKATVRFHDQQSGLVAGVEGAALDVDWKGPGSSIITSLVGDGRVNETKLPMDLVVAVADVTDAAAIPTPKAADVTFRLLLDGREPPVLEGGLQQKVGDTVLAMRFDADVARLVAIGSAVAPRTALPAARGRAKGDLRVAGIGGDRTTVSLTMGTTAVTVPGTAGSVVTLPDLSLQGTGALRVMDERIEQVALSAKVTGLDLAASIAALPFSGPGRDTAISLKVDADLEPFTLQALRTAGMKADRAPATGTLTVTAATTAGVEDGAPTTLDIRIRWEGGELRTLAPFAEDPPALAGKPFNLSATSFDLGGVVTFDPEARTVQSEGLTWTSAGLGEGSMTVNASVPEGARPEGVVVANLSLDLSKLKAALGAFAPPTLGTLAGVAKTRLQVRTAESRPTSIDFGVEVPSLTLSVGEPPMNIFRGEPVAFDSVVKLGSGDASVLVESAGLRSPLGNVTAAGKLVEGEGAVVDAEWSASLARVFAVVNAAKPVSGLRDLSGEASGTLSARYTRPEEPTVLVEGAIKEGTATLDSSDRVPLPSTFVFDVTPTLDRPAGPSVRIDRAEATWPGLARATAKGTVASEGGALPVMLDGTIELDHAGLIAILPASAKDKLPAGFTVDGSSTTTFSTRGDASPTNAAPGSLQLQLKTDASIPAMALPMAEGRLLLSKQSIKASVDAEMAPANPSKARFVATWEHRADRAEGPRGLAIAGLQTAVHFEGASTDRVNLMPGFSFDSLSMDLESGRLTLPASRAALDVRTEQAFTKLRLEPSRVHLGTVASWSGGGSLDRATGEWSLKGEGRVSDLAAASRMLVPAAGGAPAPEYWGSVGITHDISGVPDPIKALARRTVPFRGAVELRGDTLAADFKDGRTFGGGKGSVRFTAEAARIDATGELRLATLRSAPEPAKALADVVLSFAAESGDLDRLDVTRLSFAAGNMKTSVDSTGRVSGLHAILMRAFEDIGAGKPVAFPAGVDGWLSAVSLHTNGKAILDTSAFADPVAGLALSGPLEAAWSGVSRPDATLAVDLDVRMGGVNAASKGSWRVDQTSGTLGLAKSWRLGRSGFRAPDPQFRQSAMERVEFDADPFTLRIRNLALRTRAADNGIMIEARTPFMNGGPAAFDGTINLVRGEPVLEGSLQSTKFDMRTILPGAAKKAPAPLELDAITRVKWNLGRTVETGNLLEGLEVTSAIPRIDLATILAIARSLQPFIGNAMSVASEAALRTGVPSDATMTLRNGTMNFSVRVKLPFPPGVVDVPVATGLSFSNAVKAKDFTEVIARIAAGRAGLRALLAESLEEAMRAPEPPGGTGR